MLPSGKLPSTRADVEGDSRTFAPAPSVRRITKSVGNPGDATADGTGAAAMAGGSRYRSGTQPCLAPAWTRIQLPPSLATGPSIGSTTAPSATAPTVLD